MEGNTVHKIAKDIIQSLLPVLFLSFNLEEVKGFTCIVIIVTMIYFSLVFEFGEFL